MATTPDGFDLFLLAKSATVKSTISELFYRVTHEYETYQSSIAAKKEKKMFNKLFRFVLPFLNQVVFLLANVFDHLFASRFQLVHLVLQTEPLFLFVSKELH